MSTPRPGSAGSPPACMAVTGGSCNRAPVGRARSAIQRFDTRLRHRRGQHQPADCECASRRPVNAALLFALLVMANATFDLKAGPCVDGRCLVMFAADLPWRRRCQAEYPPTALAEFPGPAWPHFPRGNQTPTLTPMCRHSGQDDLQPGMCRCSIGLAWMPA